MNPATTLLAPAVRLAARWAFDDHASWEQVRARVNLLSYRPFTKDIEPVSVGGVPTEIISPKSERRTSGVLLYLHGGGYTTGSPRTHRPLTQRLANLTGLTTFVPDYRLAPEHEYPAAVEDAFAVYEALRRADPSCPIIVAGDSAGGALSLAVGLTARERDLAMPAVIGLVCPGIDGTSDGLAAMARRAEDAVLTVRLIERFYGAYAPRANGRPDTISPIHADLHGLPPLVIDSAGNDLLAPQSRALAKRAAAHGVQVSHYREHPGMWHDFQILTGLLPQADEAVAAFADSLTRHLPR